MCKKLFLLLFSAIMGIIIAPDMLTSADSFEISTINFNAVETVPLPEPEPEPVYEIASYAAAPVTEYVAPAPQMINYNVTIATGAIVQHNLSYSDIYRTGALVYGHNTWNLMGNLSSLGIGSNFTITEGGVTTTYQVANVVLFEKNDNKLQLNGSGSYMAAVAQATHMGQHYSVALMTCAGQSYGNGDASHRLVVFANQV